LEITKSETVFRNPERVSEIECYSEIRTQNRRRLIKSALHPKRKLTFPKHNA